MAHKPTFGDRFGFVRWLLLLGRDELPGFAEIGRAVGRTGQAVSAWTDADEAPPGALEFYDRLADYFGVDMRWLVRGQGEPPEPALWAVWLEYRGRRMAAATQAAAPTRTPKKRQVGRDELRDRIAKEREKEADAAPRKRRNS